MRLRTQVISAVAVLAAVLTGCSSAIGGLPTADPPPPLTAPAGQVVFQVSTSVGYAPTDFVYATRPTVTVYGDGRAFVLDADRRRAWSGQPLQLLRGTVDRPTLERLVADAHRSGLFGGVDFGDPRITDLGTTGVTFRPGEKDAVRASAYALGYEDDNVAGLDGRQRFLRTQLSSLIARIEQSVTSTSRWTPDRIDVRVASGEPDDRPQPWPGPDLSRVLGNVRTPGDRGRCGVLLGEDARRVFTAAVGAPGSTWTAGGRTVGLVVRALLPGEPACTP